MNKIKIFASLILSISTILTSSGEESKRYEIKLHDFEHLEIDNNIRVDYNVNPDSAGYVVFYATPETASRLYFNENPNKKKVDIQCCAECNNNMDYPHLTIYSTNLRKIVNSGDSLVVVNGLTPCERFDATLIGNGRLAVHDISATKVDAKLITGSGQLIITGACTTANLSLTGTGTIQADGLKAVDGKVTVAGTGSVGCDYQEVLTIQGVGTGKIYLRQQPVKIKNHALGIKYFLMQ